jgi:hypothetical protein
MSRNKYSQFDPRKGNLDTFSKEQWAAIALYREARKQQRKLQTGAVFLALIVAGAAAISGLFPVHQSDPAFFRSPWIRFGIPALSAFFAVMALALSFLIVVRAKSLMRKWRVPENLIQSLEKYPTERL